MTVRIILLWVNLMMGIIVCIAQADQKLNLTDTLTGQSDDVVVTATRTERKLSHVAVPAFIIYKSAIEATQLRRLNELLQEQTGIFVTSGSGSGGFGGGIFGNGAQLQGMSPDYTMVLINGEPIVGRQGGTINLSRLSLGNIKKIEVIKGPGSSLYGSEAMGGVINIITELPNVSGGEMSAKVGGYGLFDGNVSGTIAGRQTKLHAVYNHFRMGAIDFDPGRFGNQQDPFNTHTFQVNLTHQFSANTRLLVYGRYYDEEARNAYEVADENIQLVRVKGNTRIRDANINTSLQHRFSDKVSSTMRVYGTGYHSSQNLALATDKSPYYSDDFRQQFYRFENQTDILLPADNTLTAGGGYIYEHLNTTRYEGTRTNSVAYGFVQNEWKPAENLNIIGGLRYDDNSAYASRFSPKLAVRYSPGTKLKLMASYGAGFKAPDFRQLYLSFINNASGGYTLFGANEISVSRLESLRQQGFVATILNRANDLALLMPETSNGLNIGATYTFNTKVKADISLFNNDIDNQIMFDVIALRANGSQVFSYFNVARSFTRGGEINLHYQWQPAWTISGGYQLLYTGDKDVIAQIKAGTVFGRREESGRVYQLSRSEYLGLPGRSRHMGNLKLAYANPQTGWQASLRAIYRSGWGTFDEDGNGIINRKDEMADGFVMVNANTSKTFGTHYKIGVGIENMLNHRDAAYLPNMPGINGYLSLTYNFQKKQ